MSAKGPVRIIGWRERVGFPQLGLDRVRAKVDTGASSSSLHAEDIEIFNRGSREWVRFRFTDAKEKRHKLEAHLHERRWIKSSNGAREHRPVIRALLALGGLEWTADVTLTSRDTMGFPMLLGREATRGRFLIDPERSFLWRERRKKSK